MSGRGKTAGVFAGPLRVFLYVFALTPFFLFSGIDAMLGEGLRQIWQIAGTGILFLLVVMQDSFSADRYTVCFSIYQIEVFAVTTIKSQFRSGILITALAMICILLLIRHDRVNVMHAVAILMSIVVIVNLVSMLKIGTGGFDKKYFIGGKNKLSLVLVPSIFIFFLLAREAERMKSGDASCFGLMRFPGLLKKAAVAYSGIAIFSVIYGGSGTGFVVAALSMVCLLLIDRIPLNRSLLWVIVALNLIIMLSKDVFHSPLWISITSQLGKDPTLTYRTTVWEGAMNLFLREPLLGVGKIFTIAFTNQYGMVDYVWEAHNAFLQVLCDGGMLGAVLFLTAVGPALYRLDLRDARHKIVFAANLILLINGLTEVINYNLFTILFQALANSCVMAAAEEEEALTLQENIR